METLTFRPQSVILFVGPSNCGKSHFITKHLIPQLREQMKVVSNRRTNIQYISSDNLRREMLGYNPFNDDPATMPLKNEHDMMQTSEQAFKLLKERVLAAMSYPVNAEFIFIDTTGLSKRFREDVREWVRESYYHLTLVVFDYKFRKDYTKYIDKDDSIGLRMVSEQLQRFKEDMADLNRKNYPDMIKIKTNDFTQYEVAIDNLKKYAAHFIDHNQEYAIIGDVHGCYDELVELVEKNRVEGRKMIYIGDLIDKGSKIREVIDYVYDQIMAHGDLLVKGNHENFVYNYLKGSDELLTPDEPRTKKYEAYLETEPEVIQEFFDSIPLFQSDNLLKIKFYELVERSREFYITPFFIVTHAPCKQEVMGKISGRALKGQRDAKYTRKSSGLNIEDLTLAVENDFAFIKTEARRNMPIHVMGHVAVKHVVSIQNKYIIDTGCVSGGRLVSLTVNKYGKPLIHSIESKQPKKELMDLFGYKDGVDLATLEPHERTRVKFLCLNKVNFISGTMAPSDKDIDNADLESLYKGIQYYKDLGVKKVILQPKHMGSRGNVYLFAENEKSYLITRNGYVVNRDSITPEVLYPVYDRLRAKLFNTFEKPIKLIILDAEILPWYSMGKELITEQFIPVGKAVKSEVELLTKTGFEDMLKNIETSPEYLEYHATYKNATKELMTQKYGHSKERTFRNFLGYHHVDLIDANALIDEYMSQVELFGDPNIEFDIQPFSILKVVFDDDTEKTFENESNIEMFSKVSDMPCGVLDFERDDNVEYRGGGLNGYTSPLGFFYHITETLNMEGIVIKPEIVYTPGIAPYLKVRNHKYLDIVYGYDYKTEKKYQKLITRKGVKRKMNTSIKEFELGIKMLKTPYAAIDETNQRYKELLAHMIVEVTKEKELDPRL